MHLVFGGVTVSDEFNIGIDNQQYTNTASSNMQNYDLIKTIGTGSFARVELAKHKKTDNYVAIKTIHKNHACDLSQQVHTIWEYQILSKLSHPFIVKLNKMYQDKHKIYFIMEYIIGGELFCLMKKAGKFKEIHTAFYSAQMILALHYLHKNHIIYRALVPENILIDNKGYLKLTDFGFSKRLRLPSNLLYGFIRENYAKYRKKMNHQNRHKRKLTKELKPYLFSHDKHIYDEFKLDDKDILPLFTDKIISTIRRFAEIEQTYTLCGTPEYVAPEILLNHGYSFSVDWWSLGIIIYELLTTVTPFANENDNGDICDIYSNIVNQKYNTTPFPPKHFSESCKDLLNQLLTMNPSKRLGSQQGAIDIMTHKFYAGINWVKLLQKKMKKVPWIPVTKNKSDTIYFEEYEEEIENGIIDQEFTKDIFKKNAFNKLHLDNSKYDEECKLVSYMMRQTNTILFNNNGLLNLKQFMDLLNILQLDDVYDENVLERIFYFLQKDEDIAFHSRKQVSYITYSDLIGCNYDDLISIIENSSHSTNSENEDFHVLLSKLVLDQLQWVHDKILDGIRTKRDVLDDDEDDDDEQNLVGLEDID